MSIAKKYSKFLALFLWLLACSVYGFNLDKAKHSYICDYINNKTPPIIKLQRLDGKIITPNFIFQTDGLVGGYSDTRIYRWVCVDDMLEFYARSGVHSGSIIHADKKTDGNLSFLTSDQLELIVVESFFSRSCHFLLLAIILIFPFFFFLTLKSIWLRTICVIVILFGSVLYYQNDFSSARIFYHLSPSLTGLIIASSVSGFMIWWSRGISQKFNKIDIYLILYAMASIIWMSSFTHSFWTSPRGGHWFYALNGLFHGTFSMGHNPYLFADAAPFKNGWYPPYPYGSVIFPLFFGAQIKFGAIVGAISAIYLYLRIYKFAVPAEIRKLTITVILSIIFLSAVLFSGTFYTYPPLGSSIFLAAAIVHYFSFKKNAYNKDIAMVAIFFVVATLFRIEVILALIPILIYEIFSVRKLKTVGILCSTFIISVILYLLQNYMKFGNPFETGYTVGPNPSPISINHLQKTIFWYFIDMPRMASAHLGFLKFAEHGSEAGGYFILKYIGLVIGLFIWLFGLFYPSKYLVLKFKPIFLSHLHTINFICLSCGISVLSVFLLGFNTSPRYDMLFAPILVVSGFYFLPRSNVLNFSLLLFLIWIHIANLLNFVDHHGWMM